MIYLKWLYNAFLKIIIWCIWCNIICWHAFMFKKHIIFQILYIIVSPLSNASFSSKSLLPTSAVCSDWRTDPEHCDWPTPQARVKNVMPLSIISSFSFQIKCKRQLIMSLNLPSVQAWTGNRVAWQTQWWCSYVFAHKPRLRKLTLLLCDPVSPSLVFAKSIANT